MPIQATDFERSVIFRSESASPGHPQQPGEDSQSNDHVQRVQACHYEIKREENLGVTRIGVLPGLAGDRFMFKTERWARDMVLVKLLFVLDALDTEKSDAEKHGEDKHCQEQRAARCLRRPYGENDSQAAADQNGRVGSAESSVDRLAGGGKIAEVPSAINQIGAEEAAEEHDFGSEKDPHAEVGGILLLLRGGKVVQERRVMAVSFTVNGSGTIVQREPPLCEARPTPRSCRLPRSLQVPLQN